MSYGFGLRFKQCKSFEEAVRTAIQCSDIYKTQYAEVLKLNEFYIPSRRSDRYDEEHDNYWIYSLFNIQFVWWEKWNLLAVQGLNHPHQIQEVLPTEIYFQNSTDQDYNYEYWRDNIYLFREIKQKVLDFSIEKLYQQCKKSKDWIEQTEIEANPEYWRKSYLYDTIYEELELNKWLYGGTGTSFIRFTLNAIDSMETHFKISSALSKMLQN